MNPFKFGLEVSGKQFYDRTDTGEKLFRRLSGGASNIVMYAPRRYGKTSLVKKVLGQLNEHGIPTIYFDLNRVESLERFCEDYVSALCSLAGKAKQTLNTIETYLQHLHPTFSFGGDFPISVKLAYGGKMTASSLSSVLDFAEKVGAGFGSGHIVVAFDEFQEVKRLSPEIPMEGTFRSCIQAHNHVRYIFFGSKTHILNRMCNDKSRPFYKSASVIKLPKPPKDESVDFVKRRFASSSIIVDDIVAEEIVKVSENIPYYLQELCSIIYEIVQGKERDYLELGDIEQAANELIGENSDYYSEKLTALSATQRVLLAALAREPVKCFREDYRARHALGGSSTVNTALKAMQEAGVVESEDGVYFVGDPFFAKYIQSGAALIGW